VWGCDVIADELAETWQLCAAVSDRCTVRTVDVTDREAVFGFVEQMGMNLLGDWLREALDPTGRIGWNQPLALCTSPPHRAM
jgi:hypothetical protein